MNLTEHDHVLWREIRQLEQRRFDAINAFFNLASNPVAVLVTALKGDAWDRTAALKVLLETGNRDYIINVFPTLLDLATGMHGLLDLVREVIRRTPQAWLDEHLGELVLDRLKGEDDGGYRRLAELLSGLEDYAALDELVRTAIESDDPNLREVGEDFAERPRPLKIFR